MNQRGKQPKKENLQKLEMKKATTGNGSSYALSVLVLDVSFQLPTLYQDRPVRVKECKLGRDQEVPSYRVSLKVFNALLPLTSYVLLTLFLFNFSKLHSFFGPLEHKIPNTQTIL